MIHRSLLVSAVILGSTGVGVAQRLNYVQSNLPPVSADGFSAGVSQPTAIAVVGRGDEPLNVPADYADLVASCDLNPQGGAARPCWTPWLQEATTILQSARGRFVDITSLTFPEPTQRAALLRAIAYNVIDHRMTEHFTLRHGGRGKLFVRVLFGQDTQGGGAFTSGFLNHADDSMAPWLASAFLDQFQAAYIRRHGQQAWNTSTAAWGEALNQVIRFGLVYAFWGSAPTGVPTGNWNHSKIVSNAEVALVGGTNMYTDYLSQPDQTGVIMDADLELTGQPANYASRWVDTLFTDYRRVLDYQNNGGPEVGRRMMGVITFTNTGSFFKGYCACKEHPGIWCSVDKEDGTRLPWSQHTWGCFWGGSARGRINAPWTHFGAMPPPVPFAAPAPGSPTVISAGERGNRGPVTWGFRGDNGLTDAQITAYDSAIGDLIWSADDNQGTKIMVSQQDILNSAPGTDPWGGELGNSPPPEARVSWQRWRLTERIAYELMKGGQREHLRVFMIKSNQQTGKDYNLLPLFKDVDAIFKDTMEWYEYMWTHAAIFGFPQSAIPFRDWIKRVGTRKRNEFCTIFQAGQFVHTAAGARQYTRLHNKLVLVTSPSTSQAGVSIGSLNFYNALMMNDYGNIVFDHGSSGSVSGRLQSRFEGDWGASTYPDAASDFSWDHPRHCWWQCAPGTPCKLQ